MLHLKAGRFDPVSDEAPGPASLHMGSTYPLYIVQFDGPVRQSWLEEVRALGTVTQEYVPDHAFYALIPKGMAKAVAAVEHVRYVGPAHPAYRIHPTLWQGIDNTSTVELELLTWDRQGAGPLANRLVAEGGAILWADGDWVTAKTRVPIAVKLLRETSLGIKWIEPRWDIEPINDNVARTARARQPGDGFYDTTGHAMWSYNSQAGRFEGYTGEDVTIAVSDTGLDDSHPAFTGRIVRYYDYRNDGEMDTSGHGTHVAGTALGDGSWRTGDLGVEAKYSGVAPQAGLVVQEVFYNPVGPRQFGRDADTAGATISSNSWVSGGYGDYNSVCTVYDDMTRDANNVKAGNQPILYVFGAGNDGRGGEGTIRPPSLAKNVISVGSVGNDKWGASSNSVSAFSSQGPTTDGRIKPDVLLPGYIVASARSLDPGAATGWSRPVDGGSSYVYGTGTSMATPGVAGSAAVVRNYLAEAKGEDPSPAMVKALLINGATPLAGYEYPGFIQGWGRVNLDRSLLERTDYRIYRFDQEVNLNTNPGTDEQVYWFMVNKEQPLKVTLVWTDVAGTTSSLKNLINDLDLQLISPDGQLYSGNDFQSGLSMPNATGNPDRTNNVEGFLMDSPKEGLWKIIVKAYNVPQGAQDFALAVSGNVRKGHVDLTADPLKADRTNAEEFSPIELTTRLSNIGNRNSTEAQYVLERVAPNLTTETLFEGDLGALDAGQSRNLKWTVTGVRGEHVFRLKVDPEKHVIESNETNNAPKLEYFFSGYDVGLTAVRTNLKGNPGMIINFSLTLRNLGNVKDDIILELTEPPPGWAAQLTAYSYPLDASTSTGLRAEAVVPLNATVGEQAVLWVTATSDGNSTKTKTLRLQITVNQVYGMEVAAVSGPQDMLPGQQVELRALVRNTGNGPEVFTISIASTSLDGWMLLIPNDTVEVPLRSETEVPLLLVAPNPAPWGTSIEFQVGIASSLEGLSKEVTYTAKVIQFFQTEVTVQSSITEGDVGDPVTIPLTIANRGNGPVDYTGDINFPDETWVGGLDIQGLALGPYSEAEGKLTFDVPPMALNKSYPFTLVVISSGAEIFMHNFTFSVRQFHDPNLRVMSEAPTVTQGDVAHLQLRLDNYGNGNESIKLVVSDWPSTWTWEFSDEQPVVEPFSASYIDLTLETEASTSGGEYVISIVGYYGDSMREEVATVGTVNILTRPDLQVLAADINLTDPEPVVGSTTNVLVTIRNLGETVATGVYVQLLADGIPVGAPGFVDSILPGEHETITLMWTADVAGFHQISAWADSEEDVDEGDESNNRASVDVTVKSLNLKTTPGPTIAVVLLAILVAITYIALRRRRAIPN
jgi:uncharacterized membrane protein